MAASIHRPDTGRGRKEQAMRAIRSLLKWLVGLSILAGIGSAVAAALAKARLVSRGGEMDDEFDLVAIYDELSFSSHALAFRQGSVLTWYGGGTLDLTEANLDPAGATLVVRAIFGGIQLVVPQTWPVEIQVASVFGGVADARDQASVSPDAPRLTLTGTAVFGGVAVLAAAVQGDAGPDPIERAAEAGAGG
jgi:hypothetical protein